ncbi:hypothetical protein CR203_20695 [Salipaludibacillus neizhouensis]|uniref:Spore coat protein n=1 Tax=Salipaludibacillus neizhouensis TaxID=885475 RepID=A0A3A9JYD4_9BACI|nr:spore coat protein [Salipaludibacillus neizhouensis]RKL65497.1 hypothetical protein CR203_20695 [Salipaludibacillus neizhouensis]
MDQQTNKISNPPTQVPKTPQMNARDYANDMLSTEKYMTDAYATALNEASHQALYLDIEKAFLDSQRCQRELFNLMFEKGWYSFEKADTQKIDQAFQQFSGYSSQFPYQQ